jgi:arylformamidase
MRSIDISVNLGPDTAVWPGDKKVKITKQKDMRKGDVYNLSSMELSLHTGTHIDAPRHFYKDGQTIDELPLEAVVGKARVIYVAARKLIEPDDLKKFAVRKGERLLIKTANSIGCRQTGKFIKEYVCLSEAAAEFLAQKKLRCIGVDSWSPGRYEAPMKAHKIFMDAGVWIIENLDLSKVAPGPCELICLPLRIIGADGAPARAVLRK